MAQRTLTPNERFNLSIDERIREVTTTARDYQKQVPGMAWSEAVRLAEKHVPHRVPGI